ncbi:porin family protein [Pontibacter chinhatensis]|uniref:Outer membrane protein beta-barrel domain-containing protein n=1 Tax=Pontibacter chinhatensis TaxID=1436961 RepID=A0A1I2WZG4_9BACT|nr:porin family protein [Pontibacter chinhatensis]SFH06673.1 Outer membrane protein beta-barrel domain-containing protein [Pontibacter chinhatensis]
MKLVLFLLLLMFYTFPVVAYTCRVQGSMLDYLADSLSEDSTRQSIGTNKAAMERKVRFGVKISGGMSNMNFNKGFPKPANPVDASWNVSIGVGGVLEVPLYKNLYLQQEYLYADLGGESKEQGLKYRLGYLSLPVLFKYQLNRNVVFLAGSQFDLLLYANERHEGNLTNIMHETEERNIGLIAGLEYKLTEILYLDARVMHGINHIGIEYGGTSREFKWESLQLSVVVRPFK